MRRSRIFIYLALILVVGAGLLYLLGSKYLGGNKPVANATPTITPTPVVLTQDVVVVTQHIARADVIREDQIGYVPYQKDLMVPGMFTDAKEVVGRIARLDLDSGIILMSNMITDAASQIAAVGSDAALQIPKGKVAVSIPINRLSVVSYAPQKGDHVNVIVTMMFVDLDPNFQTILPDHSAIVIAPGPQTKDGYPNWLTYGLQGGDANSIQGRIEVDSATNAAAFLIPSESQRPRLVSQTLIRDVTVLHVGNFQVVEENALSTSTPTKATTAQPTQVPVQQQGQVQPTATPVAPPPPDVITLIVSPQDAVTLNYLIFGGAKLTLALRSPLDNGNTDATEAVTLQFLLDRYGIPLPLKLPYGMNPRVDVLQQPLLPNDIATPIP